MADNMRITANKTPYTQYSEKSKSSTIITPADEKTPEYDVLELGTEKEEKDPELKRMEEHLERIRTMRFSDNKKPKRKVEHNSADIKAKMMTSNSKMVVRMALSEAYREMATISVCGSSNGYDAKDAAKALAQIKKVIAAGKLKIANLTKEERAELAIRRAKKKLENQEVQELKRELAAKRHHNRKKERHVSGNPQNGGRENRLLGRNAEQEYWNPLEQLGTGVLPASELSGTVSVGIVDGSIPDASVPVGGMAGGSMPSGGGVDALSGGSVEV